VFTSPFPDVEIPDVSVSEFLYSSLTEEDLTRPAVIDPATGAATTYGQLRSQVDGLAGALAAHDVGVGTVVALLCPNIPVYVAVFHGLLRTGATVTTVHTLSTADEIEAQLRDAGASWAVTISAVLDRVTEAAARVGIPDDRIVTIDEAPGHPDLRSLLAERLDPPDVTFDPATHVAVVPYSSGTTGRPKGVMLTDRNLVANVQQMLVMFGPVADDRVHAMMPFFHMYGLNVLINLTVAARAALVPMARFDFAEFLGDIQRHRCTVLYIAPPVAVALAKDPIVDRFDLSSVRIAYSGAAPLDGEVARVASERIGAPIRQAYGMSELTTASHATPPSRAEIPSASVGLLIPNETCKIIDMDTGEEITETGADGWSRPGELWVAGPNVMHGYLRNPEATATTIDQDCFLHTGDVGVYHRDGYFAIVDRVKELIKYHGHQVAPAELEALLLSHPLIADAAVIGVTDDDGEEIPKAFIVPAPGAGLTPNDVMAYVAERVEPHKKIRRVEFIDAIPKSASGKILRKDLRARETSDFPAREPASVAGR
jgi:acyl-CoA synthetase (AMP-forming)/AMP-acid ligase II